MGTQQQGSNPNEMQGGVGVPASEADNPRNPDPTENPTTAPPAPDDLPPVEPDPQSSGR